MLTLWLQFFACAGVIVYCGRNLSRYGDVIAEKLGLGRAWVGLVLMASVTSLPELTTGISAVTVAAVPDIALGNILGACVFNLFVIAILDLVHGKGPIFSRAEHGHILSAGFGIILIGIVAVSMLVGNLFPAFLNIGLYTPLIIIIYLIGIRSVYLFERKRYAEFVGEVVQAEKYGEISLRRAIASYSVNAVVIIITATLLPFLGDRLAEMTGLGRSFIGTFFIALATTLPELSVSITAVRIGATDMAMANLFGSNMFNVFILAIDDFFYTKGPLLRDVSTDHAITGLMAMIMTGIAVIALTFRLERKVFLRLGWDAIALLLAYAANLILLFSSRNG